MSEIVRVCAACGNRLKLDSAFAGSICRCGQCGHMMAVTNPAARARRPDRPMQPTAVISAPIPLAADPDEPGSVVVTRINRNRPVCVPRPKVG